MNSETLEAARERLRPYVERAGAMSGWDFSQVRTRRLPPDLPWDYVARARELVSTASAVLDVGTGGGERFSEICAGLRLRGVATEAWAPNVPAAAIKLHPLGIDIVHCQDEVLPFTDASYDVVINRHSACHAREIARVLKPGGVFLTQQVDNDSRSELRSFFPVREVDWGHTFEGDVEGLRSADLVIVDARRSETRVAFEELGDVVMSLIRTPWELTDFDPLGRDLRALLSLEKALPRPEGIVLSGGRGLIEARKVLS